MSQDYSWAGFFPVISNKPSMPYQCAHRTLWQPWWRYQRTCCSWKMGSRGAKVTPFRPLLALTALSSHPALSSCRCHSRVLTDFARRLVESSSNTELNYTLLCFALFYGCFEDIRRLKVPQLQNRAVIKALFWEEIVRLIAWLWNVISPYT